MLAREGVMNEGEMATRLGLPGIPAIAESGFPGYQSTSWHGFVAPVKVPAPIIKQLHGELVKVTQNADVKRRFSGAGLEPRSSPTADDFGKFVSDDVTRWARAIKHANIKL